MMIQAETRIRGPEKNYPSGSTLPERRFLNEDDQRSQDSTHINRFLLEILAKVALDERGP